MDRESIEIQNLPRIANELLILSSLVDRKRHGYEIALYLEDRSGGTITLQYGTLYPILHRLEKAGYIKGSWVNKIPLAGRAISTYRTGKLEMMREHKAGIIDGLEEALLA